MDQVAPHMIFSDIKSVYDSELNNRQTTLVTHCKLYTNSLCGL